MSTPRMAVMSDEVRRVHGPGRLAEAAWLELVVGDVEDTDPEGLAAPGAVEAEPHPTRATAEAKVRTPMGSSRLDMLRA